MRHAAGATSVSVTVHRLGDQLVMVIEYNGPGLVPESITSLPPGETHLGLAGMREQDSLAGGVLVVTSTPGQGAKIRMQLPFT